jgi:hypothetical protein
MQRAPERNAVSGKSRQFFSCRSIPLINKLTLTFDKAGNIRLASANAILSEFIEGVPRRGQSLNKSRIRPADAPR